MTISAFFNQFGYQNEHSYIFPSSKNAEIPRKWNKMNALGYIPLVGFGIATLRFLIIKDQKPSKPIITSHVVRIVFEAIGAGLALFILDGAVSLARYINGSYIDKSSIAATFA